MTQVDSLDNEFLTLDYTSFSALIDENDNADFQVRPFDFDVYVKLSNKLLEHKR